MKSSCAFNNRLRLDTKVFVIYGFKRGNTIKSPYKGVPDWCCSSGRCCPVSTHHFHWELAYLARQHTTLWEAHHGGWGRPGAAPSRGRGMLLLLLLLKQLLQEARRRRRLWGQRWPHFGWNAVDEAAIHRGRRYRGAQRRWGTLRRRQRQILLQK